MEHSTLFNPAVREVIEKDYYPVKLALNQPLNKTEYQIYSQFATPGVPSLVIATPGGETVSSKTGFYSAVRAYILLRQTANKIYDDDKKSRKEEKTKDANVKEPKTPTEPSPNQSGTEKPAQKSPSKTSSTEPATTESQ
jgi:hypothetical protein